MNIDSAIFEALVDMHYKALYRFALSLTRQATAAADLTQETFRRLAANAHQVRDASKLKTWLFTTLYRDFLRERQHISRLQSIELMEETESTTSGSQCENALDAKTAREALLELDEVFRAPLALFYLNEHSYHEIADILGIPMGTVMSRIARGRDLLRRRLLMSQGKPSQPLLSILT